MGVCVCVELEVGVELVKVVGVVELDEDGGWSWFWDCGDYILSECLGLKGVMLWFQGVILVVIVMVKRSGVVFVVFVVGDDEQFIQMVVSWEDDKVIEVFLNSFVVIKIDIKSEVCLQFL